MKYNLGCGKNRKKGYVNVDIDEKVNPDIIEDVTITPWIWAKRDSAERIEMDNLAEHLQPFIEVAKECHWVLKNGGILWIKSPFLNCNGLSDYHVFLASMIVCFTDPTHVRYFTTGTFDYFDSEHIRWRNFGKSYGIPKFKRVKQEIKDRFLIVELEAIK